jgi:hypothetical protein
MQLLHNGDRADGTDKLMMMIGHSLRTASPEEEELHVKSLQSGALLTLLCAAWCADSACLILVHGCKLVEERESKSNRAA